MSEWKPISSAPKSQFDKLYILACDSKGRMAIGYFMYNIFRTAKPIGQPTHWMTLPEPPKQ